MKSGKLLPWRSAAEIIDWSIPAYSIFASKQEIKEKYGVNAVRPLADNTLRRVIRGVAYFISDITLRMLTPRELYSAMSFPADYIIDQDYLGNVYPKSKTVARCGNAVCPMLAYALVWANFPEWRGERLTTMSDFENAVAV